MTVTASAQTNLKLNYNNRDYEFDELPQSAQLLLQDMVRLDQQINKLQFELRHLKAARQLFGAKLGSIMRTQDEVSSGLGDGEVHAREGGDG